MRRFRILLLNLLVFLALLAMALLLPSLLWSAWTVIRPTPVGAHDPRADLPVYAVHPWARQHFDEFVSLATRYHDYVTWRRQDYRGKTITIEDGRRRTLQGNVSADASHYWFFGGSTTWGTGVTDALTYPSMFARRNGVHVANLGETAYIARQSLAYFQNLLIAQPANSDRSVTVVFYDGVNDVAYRCRKDVSSLGTGREAQIRALVDQELIEKYAFRRVFAPLQDFLREAIRRLGGTAPDGASPATMMDYRCHDDPARAEEVAQTLVAAWRQADRLARASGMGFVALLQPVAFIGRPRTDYLDLSRPADRMLALQYAAVYPRIRRLVAGEDFRFEDLSDAYDGCGDCYIDFCHVGPQAHERLVARLGTILRPSAAMPEATPR